MNWLAVAPIRGRSMMTAVTRPALLPYRRRKYSGTVLTVAARNLGARKVRITKAKPMVMIYHAAERPWLSMPCCTTPRELPPPISVAARVPAISRGPRRRPATMKSVLDVIFLEEYHPMKSMISR